MKEVKAKKTTASTINEIKLDSLLEVTKGINNNFSTPKLLEIYKDILQNKLNIGRLVLYRFDDKWKCILKYGVPDDFTDIDAATYLLPIKEISTIKFASKTLNDSFEIVIPVFHKSMPLAYVLIGDIEDKIEVSPAIKHLPFVQTLTNLILVAIENKKLAKENIRQEGVKKELELASQMQAMLFPRDLPDDEKLQVAAFYLPHQQVGGDYYDMIKLNENEVVFCMADVSGKGIAAALLMSNFQANLRSLFIHTSSLTEVVRELNTKVMISANGEKFITLFIAKYNLVTRVLTYINAGHNPPIIATGNTVTQLQVGCTGLGMFEEIDKVKEGIINASADTVIICYTDGVTEVENEKGEDYGVERFKELIKENRHLSMAKLNNLILKTIDIYKNDEPYVDDIALFSWRIH